jgi:hypothetical protein
MFNYNTLHLSNKDYYHQHREFNHFSIFVVLEEFDHINQLILLSGTHCITMLT